MHSTPWADDFCCDGQQKRIDRRDVDDTILGGQKIPAVLLKKILT